MLRRIGFEIMLLRLTAVHDNLTSSLLSSIATFFRAWREKNLERIPERSSHIILLMEGLVGKIGLTSSLHESNFACYNCISNITICGRTIEKDYQKYFLKQVLALV